MSMSFVRRGLVVSMVVLAAAGASGAARADEPADEPIDGPGCGDRYRQLAVDARAASSAAGMAARVDELLYNAGVCYESEGAGPEAAAAFAELRTRFPRSPLAARSLARLGALYARSGRYPEAAAVLEDYARTYAGEPDAHAALSDAVYYRKAMGDDEQAIAGTRYFIRAFGSKRPDEAASAFFGLASIYERRGKPADAVKHYRAYLKTYGGRGRADRVVIAHARIGQLLWEQSCPVKPVDGACLRVARARASQCGPASRRAVIEVARDPRRVKEAMASFAAARAAYERVAGRFADGDDLAARHHYALARFHQAELDHEAFLAVEFPAGLDFDPARRAKAEASKRRFAAWYEAKQLLGAKATAAYMPLIQDVRDPAHAIAAAARIGQLTQHIADALYTAEVPASFRGDKDVVAAYCDALTERAEPLTLAAADAFASCLKVSTDLGWFSSWSRLCERELGRLRPEEFPAATELRAAPAPAVPPFDPAPTIGHLPPPPP